MLALPFRVDEVDTYRVRTILHIPFFPPTYHLAKLSPTRAHRPLTAVCGRNNTQLCDILLVCAVAPAYLVFLAVSPGVAGGEEREQQLQQRNERWYCGCGG